jgi:hypothetical protein
VVTIQEQKKYHEYYEISTLKLDSLRLLIPLEKVTIKPKSHWIECIITTVIEGGY